MQRSEYVQQRNACHQPRVETAWPGRLCAHRSGVLIVEMVICAILLGTVSLILVPSLHAVARQRQAIRFDTLAMIEINNLSQLLQHSSQFSAEPERLELSAWFRQRYSDAVLNVSAVKAPSEIENTLRSYRLTVSRGQGAGMPDTECSVVVWLPAVENELLESSR